MKPELWAERLFKELLEKSRRKDERIKDEDDDEEMEEDQENNKSFNARFLDSIDNCQFDMLEVLRSRGKNEKKDLCVDGLLDRFYKFIIKFYDLVSELDCNALSDLMQDEYLIRSSFFRPLLIGEVKHNTKFTQRISNLSNELSMGDQEEPIKYMLQFWKFVLNFDPADASCNRSSTAQISPNMHAEMKSLIWTTHLTTKDNAQAIDALIEQYDSFELKKHSCFESGELTRSIPWLMPVKNQLNLKFNNSIRKKYDKQLLEVLSSELGSSMPDCKKFSNLIYICAKNGYLQQAAKLYRADPSNGLVEADPPIEVEIGPETME